MEKKIRVLIGFAKAGMCKTESNRKLRAFQSAVRKGKRLLTHAANPSTYSNFDKDYNEMIALIAYGYFGF